MKKNFCLGDVLSITTGVLLSPKGMTGIYGILNFMTGDNLFTHQLPRACDICSPYLLKQFPQLKDISAEEINPQNFQQRLADLVARFGDNFEVEALPTNAYEHKIHWLKLEEKVGKDRIIVVTKD